MQPRPSIRPYMSSCSYSRDFPSNFLFHGSLPPRSCFAPAPRALTLAGQTLCVWLISLTAVGCFVLQVWDSASSRLLADFHRSTHIASVVPKKRLPQNGSVAVSERFDKTKNLHCAGWCLLNPRRQTLRACLNTLQAFGAVAEPHSET